MQELCHDVGVDEVLLIDVGGGLGHDLQELKAEHPKLKGRLILQERPEVIKETQSMTDGIELMEHDFFTEQPVKGKEGCLYVCSKLNGQPLISLSHTRS